MMDILIEIKYQLKIYFKDKSQLFWSSIFPIVLITFFYFAFYNLANDKVDVGSLDTFKVLINEENKVSEVLKNIEGIELTYVDDDDNVDDKMNDDEYVGYIDSENVFHIKENGVNQSIMKEILEQIKQTVKIKSNENYKDINVKLDSYVELSEVKGNAFKIMYYSLISYIMSFGMYNALIISIQAQANLSSLGARISVSPMKKSTYLIAGIITTYILNLVSNIIAYIYIDYILDLNLITNIKYSFIILMVSNFLGITFGLLVGTSNNLSYSDKNTIITMAPLILSFLGGMQGPQLVNIIEKKFPIINEINPLALMTRSLYKVNILNQTTEIRFLMIKIFIISMIFLSISVVFLRRKKYDSI